MKTKRINWLLISVAALAMCACSDEEFMVEEGTENGKILFTFEATMDADTRTTFNVDYSGLNWEKGDQLSFFTDAGDINVASSKYVDGNQFKASLSSKASMACAFYPYECIHIASSNGWFYAITPFKQIQKEAGVLNGANVPMRAFTYLSSGVMSLRFEPWASLMAFNVYHSNDGIVDKLTSVTYSNSSEDRITGTTEIRGGWAFLHYDYYRGDFNESGSVALVTPCEIPRNKPNGKSRLVYLAVNPRTYTPNGTVIVTTDENKAYYFTMKQSLDLEDPYKTQTIAIDLEKAERVEPLDNLNSHFDDDNFLNFLLERYDVNLDEKLSSFEVALVTELNCSELSIKSLKGIELFTNMRTLYCGNNQLTSLDVNGCTGLTALYCGDNQLTSLEVNGCTGLTTLYCGNNQLTNLDVSGCLNLRVLNCYANRLGSLDVSGLTELNTLECYFGSLKKLDASGCVKLKTLKCYYSGLTSLNVSGCTGLTELNCIGCGLTNLDMSGFTELKKLYCSESLLTSLNVSGCTGLTELSCHRCDLTSLDLSGCTGLESLRCSKNQLTNLDVSSCAKVMTCVEATDQPIRYVTDEYGNIIVDEHGNQKEIPFEFYKAASQTIGYLQLPDGAVTIEK